MSRGVNTNTRYMGVSLDEKDANEVQDFYFSQKKKDFQE